MSTFPNFEILKLYTLLLLMVSNHINYTWQSFNFNKTFILDSSIDPAFTSYVGNESCNRRWIFEEELFGGEMFASVIWIVFHFHNRCGIYVLYFVRSRSRKISNGRHSGSNFNKKLMKTITYTYICLLLLTVSYFVRDVVSFIFPRRDLKIERNVQYWLKILVFSNSYANAFIILHNSQSKLKDVQNTTERVSRKKECKRTTFYQLVFLSVELIFLVLISLIIWLLCKSIDYFLYDGNFGIYWVNW